MSTLDDWAFVLGGEEERLQEMTDLLLKVFVGQGKLDLLLILCYLVCYRQQLFARTCFTGCCSGN